METKRRNPYNPDWNLDVLFSAVVLGVGVLIIMIAAAVLGQAGGRMRAEVAFGPFLEPALIVVADHVATPQCRREIASYPVLGPRNEQLEI